MLSVQEVIISQLAIDSMRGERLHGERFTVVGKQENAFSYFKTRAAFPFDAAHLHSSLLTPPSSLTTRTYSPHHCNSKGPL